MMSSSIATPLSSSPKSLINFFGAENSRTKSLGLDEFLKELPQTIESILSTHDSLKPGNGGSDPIAELFSRLDMDIKELSRYTHVDASKNYTRNLISTDSKHFTLLLLCWNPGKESPVHDHPCDGCWMHVCQGNVQESRYERQGDRLECFHNEIYHEGQQAYITDSMGFHKVGNPSMTQPATTLHLYCPPFSKCKIW
eukprot:CAMPEP_0119007508 /NCGR_PEP_ID=MMETSP1176-20130426/3057_1 /TAXON_ID=265551 /ORGANISM="Synedropsis recta cf, Strain CCMP1620" /LENGTH=196 /DNA_ID=CAMNT_0006959675 /DNA_START=80 /DNA_END=667 /DNA_ORIENTATION=-